jgi:hypothetical protein
MYIIAYNSKTFNIVHNNRKLNKFDNSRQFQIQIKLIRHRVVAIGSSQWVQEGIDEVVSHPVALL